MAITSSAASKISPKQYEEESIMKKIIQAHIHKGESQYVAECIDLPVVTQGRSLDELARNLREAILLHLEGEDLSAYELDAAPSILASIELDLARNAQA